MKSDGKAGGARTPFDDSSVEPGVWRYAKASRASVIVDAEDYFALIHRHFEALPISYSAKLWAEPGRALCAEYSSMIVKVEKRCEKVMKQSSDLAAPSKHVQN